MIETYALYLHPKNGSLTTKAYTLLTQEMMVLPVQKHLQLPNHLGLNMFLLWFNLKCFRIQLAKIFIQRLTELRIETILLL